MASRILKLQMDIRVDIKLYVRLMRIPGKFVHTMHTVVRRRRKRAKIWVVVSIEYIVHESNTCSAVPRRITKACLGSKVEDVRALLC